MLPDHSPPGDATALFAQEEEFLKSLDDRSHSLRAQGVAADAAGRMVTEEMKTRNPGWTIGDLSDAVARSYLEKP